MKQKRFLWSLLSFMMVAMLNVGLSSCGSDDDGKGGGANIPAGLVGTWYKTSGASKYSMDFTFNSDGSGSGYVSNDRIVSFSNFVFTYSYKSNGDVICNYTRVMVDEDGEQTVTGMMTFNYNNGKLTFVDTPNNSWAGCVFSKD